MGCALQRSMDYAEDKRFLIAGGVLSISSCSWTCLGSETVTLTSTFWFSPVLQGLPLCPGSAGTADTSPPKALLTVLHNCLEEKPARFYEQALRKVLPIVLASFPFGASSAPPSLRGSGVSPFLNGLSAKSAGRQKTRKALRRNPPSLGNSTTASKKRK